MDREIVQFSVFTSFITQTRCCDGAWRASERHNWPAFSSSSSSPSPFSLGYFWVVFLLLRRAAATAAVVVVVLMIINGSLDTSKPQVNEAIYRHVQAAKVEYRWRYRCGAGGSFDDSWLCAKWSWRVFFRRSVDVSDVGAFGVIQVTVDRFFFRCFVVFLPIFRLFLCLYFFLSFFSLRVSLAKVKVERRIYGSHSTCDTSHALHWIGRRDPTTLTNQHNDAPTTTT